MPAVQNAITKVSVIVVYIYKHVNTKTNYILVASASLTHMISTIRDGTIFSIGIPQQFGKKLHEYYVPTLRWRKFEMRF